MELRHLQYLLAVIREGQITRAAHRIGIEQSPLSRAINDLEKEIGARLFERTKPRLQTTPAGEALAEHARRILQELDQAKAAARNAASGQRFQLRIGVAQSIAQPRLARLLARSRVEDAKVAFHVTDASAQELLTTLEERLIDVALAPFAPPKGNLRSERLWSTPITTILPPEHRLARMREIPLQSFLSERLVLCHPELALALNHVPEVHSWAVDRTRSLPVGSLPTLLEMVAAGFGVGLTLAPQVEALKRIDIAVRSIADGGPQVTTYAVVQPGTTSEVLTRFLARAHELGAFTPDC
jgi:DNA-binding transcriptional LysR family regulator